MGIILAMVTGCVLSAPDYHVQPALLLHVSPYGPNVCADQTEKLGRKSYRDVTVTVWLRNVPPGGTSVPAVVTVNGQAVEFASALGARLNYKAGLGNHKIVAEAGGRTATHSLTVWVCDGSQG
jgi:hypothetical protein